MAPFLWSRDSNAVHPALNDSWKADLSLEGFIVESWSQGFLVGALLIMGGVTLANMKSDSLLHKLILLELILAIFHGTFCFMNFKGYDYYLSSTAVLLYMSLCLHDIVAWMKTKPFLKPWQSKLYLITFLLTFPYWILESYANFTFFNNINRLFKHTRPWEALCRDPWWVFTAGNLIYNVKKRYNFSVIGLIRVSPRFGIMLISMFLSIIFVIIDILATTGSFGGLAGINPYWKFSLILKCFTDVIILDDFRSALEKIRSACFRGVNPNSNTADHDPPGRPRRGSERQMSNFTTFTKKQQQQLQPHIQHQQSSAATRGIPKIYAPSSTASPSPDRDRDVKFVKERAKVLTAGLFGGTPTHLDPEERDRIYINTDIVIDNQKRRPSEGYSSSSSSH